MKLSDFYFTGDDYRYHFNAEAKQRFMDLLRERFNNGTAYRARLLKWDSIMELKANELGRFLIGKSSGIEFTEPAPRPESFDTREIRARILALTSSEAKQLGIGKSTFCYLRKSASSTRPLRIYSQVRERLSATSKRSG